MFAKIIIYARLKKKNILYRKAFKIYWNCHLAKKTYSTMRDVADVTEIILFFNNN